MKLYEFQAVFFCGRFDQLNITRNLRIIGEKRQNVGFGTHDLSPRENIIKSEIQTVEARVFDSGKCAVNAESRNFCACGNTGIHISSPFINIFYLLDERDAILASAVRKNASVAFPRRMRSSQMA